MARRNSKITTLAAMVAILVCAALLAGCGTASFGGHGHPGVDGGPRDGGPTAASAQPVRIAYDVPGGAGDQNFGDLYLPSDAPRGGAPLVMLVHGGGWASKVGRRSLARLAQDLADHGVAVYNVEYRRVGSGGGWPTTFSDALYAYRAALRLHEAWPQIRSGDIVVAGHSAGAQLAALAAMPSARRLAPDAGDLPLPDAFVSLAGAVNLRMAAKRGRQTVVAALGGTPDQVSDRYDIVDPTGNVDPRVRTILMHGTPDRAVPFALLTAYRSAAAKMHADATLIPMRGVSHVSLVDPRSSHGYLASIPTILSAVAGEGVPSMSSAA